MTNVMDIQKLSEWAQKLWNAWELRGLILLSLFLQFLLLIIGNRRKHTAGILLGFVIWSAFVSADSMAIFTLGILAHSQGAGSGTNCTNQNLTMIPAFWAPTLLVHLGGPETITAYSLEDNELWIRHLIQLINQTLLVIYALFKSWFKDPLIFIAIPIFFAGIIKCGERVWFLRLACSKMFKDSNYQRMHELLSDPQDQQRSRSYVDKTTESLDDCLQFKNIMPKAKYLHEAHLLFQMFKILYTGDVLSESCHVAAYKILRCKNAQEAFKLIEVELGFMYDSLYTKVTHWPRIFLRSFSFLCSVSALLVFSVMTIRKNYYSKIEVIVSYFLLVGAVVLEISSFIVFFSSDWGMLWLSKQRKVLANCPFSPHRLLYNHNGKRWKGSMPQYNLVNAQLIPNESWCTWAKNCLKNLLGIGNIQSSVAVDEDLKELIFSQLLEKRSRSPHLDPRMNDLKEILEEMEDHALRKQGCLESFRWAVDADFDESLLMWHVATDICYHDDRRRAASAGHEVHLNQEISRSLSNYMLYLLSDCPAMLPEGIGEARCKETGFKVSKFSSSWISETDPSKRWDSEAVLDKISRDHEHSDMSMLLNGCKLAKSLQLLVIDGGWENKRKWEMISQVWVAILAYAAIHCEWNEHAQTLTRGGELITHVLLLMTHLGLSEQCLSTESFGTTVDEPPVEVPDVEEPKEVTDEYIAEAVPVEAEAQQVQLKLRNQQYM